MGLRERKKAELRRRIMDTMVQLIRERGYEHTTVEEVVRLVDISQPTFYNYFHSKDAVLRAVARRVLDAWATNVGAEVASTASTEEKLRRLYRAQAKWMTADRPLWRAIVLSDALNVYRASDDEGLPATSVRGYFDAILIEGQRRGEITSSVPASRLAENLLAMQMAASLAWGIDALEHSLAKTLDENIDFFMRAAASRPGAAKA